jgi:hypothetical protein
MRDKDFLRWIHERLIHVHGENENVDYLMKLRSIVESTDAEKVTPNMGAPTVSDLSILRSMSEEMGYTMVKHAYRECKKCPWLGASNNCKCK